MLQAAFTSLSLDIYISEKIPLTNANFEIADVHLHLNKVLIYYSPQHVLHFLQCFITLLASVEK
jgi:hypothetical protein